MKRFPAVLLCGFLLALVMEALLTLLFLALRERCLRLHWQIPSFIPLPPPGTLNF